MYEINFSAKVYNLLLSAKYFGNILPTRAIFNTYSTDSTIVLTPFIFSPFTFASTSFTFVLLMAA